MKNIITALIFTAALSLIGCTKGGTLTRPESNQYTIMSTASSKQLVPAIDTTSTGTFTGFYDDRLNILTFTISWSDLWRAGKDTITAVNFYGPASTTENGALVRSLPFVSNNSQASVNLGLAGLNGFKESEKKNLLAGAYYFTINTKKYPNGIIRGQLTATKP
ncbi:MAG: CHRD domain-containing protein [Chitinophaga sp.]|uniref:CHRD domain-containing protein n=1 Tax=Chitinophaga sp. TaxID=1869181 RepID=UPI001B0C7908|nr:CHRD domain-containing protein [Chitinophaga sp.]MBO9729799.1 CHRD domain-containing protein [Chitinophaga sp.]